MSEKVDIAITMRKEIIHMSDALQLALTNYTAMVNLFTQEEVQEFVDSELSIVDAEIASIKLDIEEHENINND